MSRARVSSYGFTHPLLLSSSQALPTQRSSPISPLPPLFQLRPASLFPRNQFSLPSCSGPPITPLLCPLPGVVCLSLPALSPALPQRSQLKLARFACPPRKNRGFLGGSSAGGAFLHGFLGIFSWYPGFCCLQPASGGRRRRQGKVLLAHQWENAGQEGVLWVGAPQKSHSFVVCPNRRVMSCFLYCRTSTCFPGPFLCSGAIITIKPLTWLVHTRVDSGLCLRPAFAVPKYM